MIPSRLRGLAGLLLTAVVLPLLVLGLGRWEHERGLNDQLKLEVERSRLAAVIAAMEVQPPGQAWTTRFQHGGRLYAGPMALTRAHQVLDETTRAAGLARWRREVPPVVVASGLGMLVLSLLVLVLGTVLGWAGRLSRAVLAAGFDVMRTVLPVALVLQILAGLLGLVAVVAFEAMPVLYSGPVSAGGLETLGVILVLALLAVFGGVRAVLQLRGALDVFTPEPLPILGRTVWRTEAPGLWARLDRLADRLGALPPETVVVGMTGGFFVSSGPKRLEPGGALLSGRTLYVPLPYLALLREDEVDAVIAHEMAHFSGGDTEYSGRFVPIYAGVERSLRAVLGAPVAARPAVKLAGFVLDQFHHAVRRWSRVREFAADAAGARVTSVDASGRALLRTPVVGTCIEAVLDRVAEAPDEGGDDLVAAVLAHAAAGLDDPARHLEEQQPHPTDTHPPTVQRLAALGLAPDAARLAEAAAPPPEDATARLAAYFADAAAECRAATAGVLGVVAQRTAAMRTALEQAAGGVAAEELALHENTRPGGMIQLGVAGVFALAALALLIFGMPGLDRREAAIVAGVASVLALGLAGLGTVMLRRARVPFLLLRPDAMVLPGLSLPIAWGDIADLDVTMGRSGLVTRILLPPEAPLPSRQGRGRAAVDAKRRIVTLTAAAPKGFKAQGYAELIGRYRRADAARRMLAEGSVSV